MFLKLIKNPTFVFAKVGFFRYLKNKESILYNQYASGIKFKPNQGIISY